MYIGECPLDTSQIGPTHSSGWLKLEPVRCNGDTTMEMDMKTSHGFGMSYNFADLSDVSGREISRRCSAMCLCSDNNRNSMINKLVNRNIYYPFTRQ